MCSPDNYHALEFEETAERISCVHLMTIMSLNSRKQLKVNAPECQLLVSRLLYAFISDGHKSSRPNDEPLLSI